MEQLDHGLVGARLDRYEVLEEVGYGGMSVVYRARDAVLDRDVALKVLHAHLSKREESRRRFQREAKAVAKLRHPNIVEIYDFSAEESAHSYIVTELIHGPTLRELVDEKGVGFPEVGAMIGLVLAGALGHAHDLGVTHRDVKPENVMIREDGVVKLMDFGIAQLREAERVTETGSLLGSPAHMAPEVVSGEEPDVRSDIFSLGTVLYHLTTGELPFTGRNAAVVLRRIIDADYVDPEVQDPRIGRRLGGIIRKCLAERPEDRYASMDELSVDLREYLEEVGLVDVVSELRQYFAAPATYVRALRGQLLHVFEREARKHLDGGEVAKAADYLNRLLAIDDLHEVGRRLLRRLDRRRRVAGLGLAAAGLLALAAIVALAMGALEDGPHAAVGGDEPALGTGEATAPPEPTAEEQAVTRAAGQVARAATLAGQRQEAWFRAPELARLDATRLVARAGDLAVEMQRAQRRADAESVRRRNPGESPEPIGVVEISTGLARAGSELEEPVAREEVALVNVFLHPAIPVVDISVNGESMGDLGHNPGGIQLPPGIHRIRYSHPQVVPALQEIEVPDDGRARFDAPRHRLAWRPARLIIRAEAHGEPVEAQVIVDREPVGPTGQVHEIPINTMRPPRLAEIAVVADGFARPVVFSDYQLSPAQQVRLTADFSTID